jgi:hypothetical protein
VCHEILEMTYRRMRQPIVSDTKDDPLTSRAAKRMFLRVLPELSEHFPDGSLQFPKSPIHLVNFVERSALAGNCANERTRLAVVRHAFSLSERSDTVHGRPDAPEPPREALQQPLDQSQIGT